MKVLIAGGSGFIGRHLSARLLQDGHEVVVLTRRQQAAASSAGFRFTTWDGRADGDWVNELDGADAIVNLAGASIGGRRWTARRKAELLSSRLEPTGAIVQAIERRPAGQRPSVLVNASGIDYYPDRREDDPITEDGPRGTAFLARLCDQWETAAVKAEPLGVRVVTIRTSMAFGLGAPAFFLVTLPFRLFVGGPLGDGRQWFTWIHIDDLVGLYRLAIEDPSLSGPINVVAPDVRRQRELARQMGHVLHRPSSLPAPAPMLRLALGEQADLLLHGRRAVPAKAQAAGYAFAFGGLDEALEEIFKRRRS